MSVINDGTPETNSHWTALKMKDGGFLEKHIILVDFDHTITTKCLACKDGLKNNTVQKGAKEVLTKLHETYQIWIFTGNVNHINASMEFQHSKEYIKCFLRAHEIPFDKILQIKPPAIFVIDDRAIHHKSWTNTVNEIEQRVQE